MQAERMQAQRNSVALSSEASYCDVDIWSQGDEEWGSRDSLTSRDETASQATPDELSQLRSERDALARALAGSRRAAAAAAGAHDERLAELHGVIAELLRRRAADKTADAIAECESQDECDSTTQPAGELSHEADWSRTDQGDSSPALSPDPDDRELAGTESRSVTSGGDGDTATDKYPEPEVGVNSRRSQLSRRTTSASGTGSCERERGSREDVNAAGRYESRQAKLAFRVRLKRTEDDAREPEELASRAALAARCRRLEEELQDLEHALSVTSDDLHGAWSAQRALGVRARALCAALRSADRALEAYDVLLALAETAPGTQERCAAQRVACELVARLRAPSGREPALPPGPWADHRALPNVEPWSEDMEPALREYCALLKTQSAELRPTDLSELEVAAERVRLEPGTCSKKGSCRRQRSSKERIRHRTGSAPASETDL